LRHVEGEGFQEIHFFGDKTYEVRGITSLSTLRNDSLQGGNDYEIYNDPRIIGHSVQNPVDALRVIKEFMEGL
jgi:phosphomannomutase